MQAVILALHDSPYLRQLTVSGVVGQLPLGKRGSVLSNLVDVFESVGITDPIILCRPGHSKQVEKCLPEPRHCVVIEVAATLTIPDCLHRIRDRFTCGLFSQYLFLTYADLVVTELDLRDLFLRMVRTNAQIVALAAPYTADSKLLKTIRGTHDVMVLDSKDESLVMYTPAAELKKQIRIPKSIMSSHDDLICRADLHDAGMYLLSGYAIRMIEHNKDDVGLRKSFFKQIVNIEQHKPFQLDTNTVTSQLPRVLRYSQEELPQNPKVVITVLENPPICRRLDSVLGYLDAVKVVRERYSENKKSGKPALSANAGSSGGQAANLVDVVQGEGCNFANGVLIRSCIVSANCTLGQNTKLFGSVLLTSVVVGSGCKITNCVIGEGVTIEDNCILKDCTVAAHQHILAKSVMQSENMGFSEIDFDNLTI